MEETESCEPTRPRLNQSYVSNVYFESDTRQGSLTGLLMGLSLYVWTRTHAGARIPFKAGVYARARLAMA
jgi:hypothetical protein